MNEDIVTRLRHNTCFGIVEPLSAEAADEIKRLRKELAILRIEQVLKESQELELYE
jgi:transposase-like protein